MHNEIQKDVVAQIRPGVLDDAARAAYASAFTARCDTSGGLGDMETCLETAMLFDIVMDGRIVGRYALKKLQRAHGFEVFVVAAAGRVPGADLIASIEPFVARQCADADRLTVTTKRRGLVKKLMAKGWTLDSFVLRKNLND